MLAFGNKANSLLGKAGSGIMNSDGNSQPLDLEQLEGSNNTVQNGRFSISPRSLLNGVERKKSWGRQVSIRKSSSQLYKEERQEAAPRTVRASTWCRERRVSIEDNDSPDCISTCREPNDGKSFVHGQVLSICAAFKYVEIIKIYCSYVWLV